MEEKKVNKVLRRERELRGWSQQVVAGRVGTTEQVVSRWEGGFHRPNKYFQAQLCELFGKSAEELGLIDPPQDVVAEKRLACVTRLRETIHYLGKSEEQVAQDLSMSKRTLSHYVYGKVVVPDELRAKFAAYFGCTEAFLFPHPSLWLPGVVKEGPSEAPRQERVAVHPAEEADALPPRSVTASPASDALSLLAEAIQPVPRVKDLRSPFPVSPSLFLQEDQPSWLSGGDLAALLAQFTRAFTKPPTIGETTLKYLETCTVSYWRDRHGAIVSSSLLLAYVLEHLQKILTYLECSLLPSERRQLCAVASGTAQLVGHLFFDLKDYMNARNFHKKAIQAAQEADHPALEAVAWGRMSFTWTYSGDAQKALPCIKKARSLATGKTAPMIQAYLSSVEAEVQAILHDREASLSALGEAEWIEKRPEVAEDIYWLRFDRSRFEGYQGTCFRRFYRPEEPETATFLTQAQQKLQDALALLSPSMAQRRPNLLIDLARTYTQQREIEKACEHTIQAIVMLAHLQSRTGMHRLLTLRQELVPWQDTPSVKQVDEHLSALLFSGGQTRV